MPKLRPRLMFRLGRLVRLQKPHGRAPGVVTALDVDGQTLRVVQVMPRGGRPAVTRVVAVSLELAADADRSDAATATRSNHG